MVNEQALRGNWNEIKTAIRDHWATLGDDLSFNGNVNQLVNFIHERTGASRESVQRFLEDATTQGSAVLQSAARVASDIAGRAVDTARDTYEQVSDNFRNRYDDSAELIRNQPMRSVATAFGAGVVIGMLVLLVMRSK